ncbi:restriction endonuclease [Muribacter muris]|uniref:Restriction endonuclease n=1 Tax=Muribacter muris TaxID=67855 RepID=A0A4Y9JY26_9PAST|nr:GIY-YIG nuclease family protein [Muribacter muris]MBF0785413.1 GIY-YIG nuclease family protein [Muribacter muris]MBF0826066.1 GIY-YIG nuclease family protein [Muribacter muris]TFV09670.1 restriction endonuclease [Muribacter muris]
MNDQQPNTNQKFFNEFNPPKIYAYSDSRFPNCLKVGYTTRQKAEQRVREQYPTKTPEQTWKIELEEYAVRENGTLFRDFDVHKALKAMGVRQVNGEWFECDVQAVQAALISVKKGIRNREKRTLSFGMRPEQAQAVNQTAHYFQSFKQDAVNHGKAPRFLWNAKMRFGKTFATYQLAKKMGWQKVLILTFKPAVQDAWQEDLSNHTDFEGWQFFAKDSDLQNIDPNRPLVCFGSFQDYLGKTKSGAIKPKNAWVHETNWDCVVFDEYHYGAWRENAKDLFDGEEDKKEQEYAESCDLKEFDEDLLPITTHHYLYLSGTPFRAISSGEFIEEQIFNWTYSDEQKAKINWQAVQGRNPYLSLPKMVMMTYQLPDSLRDIARKGEFNEFDLNLFFEAKGSGEKAQFTYKNEVQKWLDFIQNKLPELAVDTLKMRTRPQDKPPMPFSDAYLLGNLLHTFWFLPNVASCYAMRNLLNEKQNQFFHQYKIIVAAGAEAGIGLDVLPPVQNAMTKNPLATKTITLSCGKLTTGVSVPPWTGILMLRNASSPETYFQAAFRVQTPWVLRGYDDNDPNNEEILKQQCYVFDFAPDRALRQIAEYSCRLDTVNTNPEQKVAEFIHFLPVLAYDGSSMKQIDASGVLDIAMSGTTATLLARRWESALLVNVDNDTLERLRKNETAMAALNKVEGFRSLNNDIETIINKSEAVKKTKKEKGENLTAAEKKELSEQEKEYKSLRKQIQEKLIKFATRIPVFMYLTDYREHCLRDVITQLEPRLFNKVTGLTQKDFELLVNLNIFNESLMNDAVYKFKRYEDSSLEYTKRSDKVGLYSTVIDRKDMEHYS